MALLRRRFKLYGEPYDQQLFDYINGTKYPTNEQWLVMNNIVTGTIPLNDKEYGIDLRKVNQLQKEVLIPPISFYIIDIVFDNKIKYLYVDRKL